MVNYTIHRKIYFLFVCFEIYFVYNTVHLSIFYQHSLIFSKSSINFKCKFISKRNSHTHKTEEFRKGWGFKRYANPPNLTELTIFFFLCIFFFFLIHPQLRPRTDTRNKKKCFSQTRPQNRVSFVMIYINYTTPVHHVNPIFP